jgi:hypothetical protein
MPLADESDKDRFNRFRDSFAREIAEQQKVMAAITTMASALIALPILFFKDIFKETVGRGETLLSLVLMQPPLVRGAAYAGWFALVVAIFAALMFTILAGRYIHNIYKYDYPPDYLDDPATGERDRNRLAFSMMGAVFAFLAGLGLMMAFILTYAKATG